MSMNEHKYECVGVWTVITFHGYIPVKGWYCRLDWFLTFPEPFCSVVIRNSRRDQPSGLLSLQQLLSLTFISTSKSSSSGPASCGIWVVHTQTGTAWSCTQSSTTLFRLWSSVQDCWRSINHDSQMSGNPADHQNRFWQTTKTEGQWVFTKSNCLLADLGR